MNAIDRYARELARCNPHLVIVTRRRWPAFLVGVVVGVFAFVFGLTPTDPWARP